MLSASLSENLYLPRSHRYCFLLEALCLVYDRGRADLRRTQPPLSRSTRDRFGESHAASCRPRAGYRGGPHGSSRSASCLHHEPGHGQACNCTREPNTTTDMGERKQTVVAPVRPPSKTKATARARARALTSRPSAFPRTRSRSHQLKVKGCDHRTVPRRQMISTVK